MGIMISWQAVLRIKWEHACRGAQWIIRSGYGLWELSNISSPVKKHLSSFQRCGSRRKVFSRFTEWSHLNSSYLQHPYSSEKLENDNSYLYGLDTSCSRHWALFTPLHSISSQLWDGYHLGRWEPKQIYTQFSFPNSKVCIICHSATGTPERVKHANLNNMAGRRGANAPLSLFTCVPLRVPNSTTRKMFTYQESRS